MQHQITARQQPHPDQTRQDQKQKIRTTGGIRQGTLLISTPNMPQALTLLAPLATNGRFSFSHISEMLSKISKCPFLLLSFLSFFFRTQHTLSLLLCK
jgi:hypothetical protein